jgi:hypothetical protein
VSIFDQLLTHTYTRTPVNPATNADAYGVKEATPGNAVSAVACFYNPSESIRLDERGQTIIRTPVLLVKADDPLKVGDRVTDVTGVSTLESGPLTVQKIDPLTLTMGIEIKRAQLLRAKTSQDG